MTEEDLLQIIAGLERRELAHYVAEGWVVRSGPGYAEVDVARIHLIRELRHDLALEDAAIPVVLSLLDQLHEARGVLDALTDCLAEQPETVREAVAARLRARLE